MQMQVLSNNLQITLYCSLFLPVLLFLQGGEQVLSFPKDERKNFGHFAFISLSFSCFILGLSTYGGGDACVS